MISLNSQASDEAGKNIGTEAVQPFGPVYRKIELVTYIQNALYLIGNVVIFQNMVDLIYQELLNILKWRFLYACFTVDTYGKSW